MVVVGVRAKAFKPSLWPFPTEFLSRSAAAAAIEPITSRRNLDGFLRPSAIGFLPLCSGSTTPELPVLFSSSVIAVGLWLLFPAQRQKESEVNCDLGDVLFGL